MSRQATLALLPPCMPALPSLMSCRFRAFPHHSSYRTLKCLECLLALNMPALVCVCRLDDLLSEVKWVLEDYSDSEAAAQGWVDRR